MHGVVSPKRVPMAAQHPQLDMEAPDSQPDDALTVFRLLETAWQEGLACALITVVDIIGGSARGKGAHMAVLADGRYCGYVSGGCVEATIAAEAVVALENGADRVLRIGQDSPLVDVRLPCGGGMDLHIHVNPDPQIVRASIEAMEFRESFRISIRTDTATLAFDQTLTATDETGWSHGVFERVYRPRTRLVLVGRGLEVETTARIGIASGLEVIAYCADGDSADAVHRSGATAHWMATPAVRPDFAIDLYTAVIFLFHDHDWEIGLIEHVLRNHHPFFIGALGSRRTHQMRADALRSNGVPESLIELIHGPVGLFGPTRNAASLALSILGQVTQVREQAQTLAPV
ncbi:XdhC family protein [Pelagibacterium lacus]|uniref:XdhC family protein n=1 Tax=Pelagibacterium lacus TaxID=2282655 RepID=A0A369W404_9HYPH|nr:XdhC family protein [Pelagibacterium lacus]RDE09053.1 XdhC family protein [Pelagibacterium lacus]